MSNAYNNGKAVRNFVETAQARFERVHHERSSAYRESVEKKAFDYHSERIKQDRVRLAASPNSDFYKTRIAESEHFINKFSNKE